jgi:hypothetical protein
MSDSQNFSVIMRRRPSWTKGHLSLSSGNTFTEKKGGLQLAGSSSELSSPPSIDHMLEEHGTVKVEILHVLEGFLPHAPEKTFHPPVSGQVPNVGRRRAM